jgi:hypothetical protein
MPDKIGVDQTPKDLSQTMSFRAAVNANHTETSGAGAAQVTQNAETATGGSLYALAGSWGTNFGSLVEIGLSTKTSKGVSGTGTAPYSVTAAPQIGASDLQLRAVYGEADSHWNYRIGQLPLVEGFGAMDRQLASSLSLSPIAPLTATGSWGGKAFGTSVTSTPGIEVGYTYFDTEIAFASMNGLEYDTFDQSMHAYGNGYAGRDATDPLYNSRDSFFRFNHFIGKKNAISGYLYQGAVSLPQTNASKSAYSSSTYSTDAFSRASLYGTYSATDDIMLMLGYTAGSDAFSITDTVNSKAIFFAADFYRDETSAWGFRYDTVNPSNDSSYDQWQADLYYTTYWKSGLYTKVDYANTDQGQGAGVDRKVTKKLSLAATFTF